MNSEARAELDQLEAYVKGAVMLGVDDASELAGIRGYIGGAITTMAHLGHLTEVETLEATDRLNALLPPPGEATHLAG